MYEEIKAVYILFLTLLLITFLMLYVPQNSKLLLAPLGIWVLYATFLNTTESSKSIICIYIFYNIFIKGLKFEYYCNILFQ